MAVPRNWRSCEAGSVQSGLQRTTQPPRLPAWPRGPDVVLMGYTDILTPRGKVPKSSGPLLC